MLPALSIVRHNSSTRFYYLSRGSRGSRSIGYFTGLLRVREVDEGVLDLEAYGIGMDCRWKHISHDRVNLTWAHMGPHGLTCLDHLPALFQRSSSHLAAICWQAAGAFPEFIVQRAMASAGLLLSL